ncbi:MAG: hypothetical protein WBI63_04245 [Coriobacteriia bacterium]
MKTRNAIMIGALALLVTGSLVSPRAAAVSEYREGTSSTPFKLSQNVGLRLTDGDGPALTPRTAILWEYSEHMLDPRSMQVLANGNVLYASRDGNRVVELTHDKRVAWSFTTTDYKSVMATSADMLPFDADRTASGTTLITLRDGRPVFEVDSAKRLVWRYGTGTIGLGPGQLWDGYSATRLGNGNTLIADNHGARVIEVRTSDYDAAAPQMGFTQDSIVWSIGEHTEAGEPLLGSTVGYLEGYLDWPRTAQRVGANTLIADQTSQRVIEVQPSGHVVWQYGTNGVQSQGANCLFDPSGAVRAADGTTFIVDGKDYGRIVRVAANGSFMSVYPDPEDTPENGTLYEPRALDISSRGTIFLADEGHDRIIEIGKVESAKATSREIDCGLPGVKKRFLGLDWTGGTGTGGAVSVYYSVDGGAWKFAGTGKSNSVPSGVVGTTIRYRLSVTTANHLDPPVVESVAVRYEIAGSTKPKPATPTTPTPTPSRVTTVTPGAKGAGGTGIGSSISGDGDYTAFGPLQYASGTVLKGVSVPVPGMPGTGLGDPVAPGVVGGLSVMYLLGFAATPARLMGVRLLARVLHRN